MVDTKTSVESFADTALQVSGLCGLRHRMLTWRKDHRGSMLRLMPAQELRIADNLPTKNGLKHSKHSF